MKKKHDERAAHGPVIAQNRKAWHDYFIEQKFEAGLVLTGWEVKKPARRARPAQGRLCRDREQRGLARGRAHPPLPTASTHVQANPTRKRKLLLHAEELDKLIGATERKGYTLVPLRLYWQRGHAKLEIGLAKGKQAHDKRADIKNAKPTWK